MPDSWVFILSQPFFQCLIRFCIVVLKTVTSTYLGRILLFVFVFEWLTGTVLARNLKKDLHLVTFWVALFVIPGKQIYGRSVPEAIDLFI
jgi:hypothetical protein